MWECQYCNHENEDGDQECWSCGRSQKAVEKQTDNSDSQTTHGNSCPNCDSDKIIPSVTILDRDGDHHDTNLSVRIDRHPNAMFLKGAEVVSLKAWICGNCGYTQLYASGPNALWSAYEVANRSNNS